MDFEQQIRNRRIEQSNQIAKSLGHAPTNDIQKGRALPVGTIKKRPNGNFIKTPTGWKYHSKHSSHQKDDSKVNATRDSRVEYSTAYGDGKYSSKMKAEGAKSHKTKPENYTVLEINDTGYFLVTTNSRAAKFISQGDAKKVNFNAMPKVGTKVTIKNEGARLISHDPFRDKQLTVEAIVDTGLISEPQQVKVTDGEGNSIIVSKKDIQPSTKSKNSTFEQVLADPEGKRLVESIEERIGDLRDNPGRTEHLDDVKHDAKQLKEKFGYDYDISAQISAHDKVSKPKSKHIGDMNSNEKHTAAEALGIKNPSQYTPAQLNKLMISANVEKQMKEYSDNAKKNSSQPKEGQLLTIQAGQTEFLAKVDYVEDGRVYFESGDDSYSTDLEDATWDDKNNTWILSDYE